MATLIAAGVIRSGVREPRKPGRVRCSNCGEPGGTDAAFDACQFKSKGAELLCPDCYSVPAAPMEAR